MKIEDLMALGFDCVGGQLDYRGVNYGMMTKDGPALTPQGEALVASLKPAEEPKRRRKMEVSSDVIDALDA